MPPEAGAPLATGLPSMPFSSLGEGLTAMVDAAVGADALRGPNGDARAWATEVFVPWSDAQADRLARAAAARRSLRREPAGKRAVGAALHAHLMDETAAALDGVDVSGSLAEEVRRPVDDLRRRALAAYEICHELALAAGPSLDAWRVHCGARLAALTPRDAEH